MQITLHHFFLIYLRQSLMVRSTKNVLQIKYFWYFIHWTQSVFWYFAQLRHKLLYQISLHS